MPFIRYAVGDRGTVLKKKCPCGLATPLFIVEGRTRTLHLGTKNLYYEDINRHISSHVSAILQWQIKKINEKHIEFSFVKGRTYNPSFENHIRTRIENLLEKDTQIEIRAVSAMQLTTAGKTDAFIDNVNKI